MKDKKQIQERIRPVLQTFPYIFSVQIASKAIIAVWMLLLGKVFQALLKSSGRVAVTSGDFKFLFTSWQGIGILLLGLVSLFIYVAFDLNTKIVLSRDLLTGENASQYDIYYRTHVQNFGWTGWASNGASCGSAGYSYRLEGIEIMVVPAGSPAPGATDNVFYQA